MQIAEPFELAVVAADGENLCHVRVDRVSVGDRHFGPFVPHSSVHSPSFPLLGSARSGPDRSQVEAYDRDQTVSGMVTSTCSFVYLEVD